MRKLALALALSFLGVATAHAAPPMGIVAPAPGALKTYLTNAKATPVKVSQSHNSQYYKFTTALAAKPGDFRTIKLGDRMGVDFSRTAYVPKVYIKGLDGNTAFIKSGTVTGPKIVSKIHLPIY